MSKHLPASRRIRAELHTHSTASDGQHPPEHVAHLCHEHQVSVWSLTDHDTMAGCKPARARASELGLRFIPGIEISAYHGRSIHVLGYGLDPDHEGLASFLERRLQLRAERMAAMVERAQQAGLGVTLEQVEALADGASLTRPHLAQALVEVGAVATRDEAFELYLGDGKPLYIASPWPSVPEAIEIVHQAGGVTVLAHPGIYDRDEHIGAWAEAGLDGIEVGHPSHDEQAYQRYEELADELGLLKTASSDFHGEQVAPDRQLGQTELKRRWLEELLERL